MSDLLTFLKGRRIFGPFTFLSRLDKPRRGTGGLSVFFLNSFPVCPARPLAEVPLPVSKLVEGTRKPSL